MEFVEVDKRFDGIEVLQRFNYCFEPGKYCIVGENGSGKTTLLMLAAGLELPDAGTIRYKGEGVDAMSVKAKIGISTDRVVFPRFLSARQLLEFHCHSFKVDWPKNLIEALHFEPHLDTLAPSLSLGNQKKLSLISALTHNAECLLLDEPSTGLDSASRRFVADYLAEFEGILLVTSHDPTFTEDSQYTRLSLPVGT